MVVSILFVCLRPPTTERLEIYYSFQRLRGLHSLRQDSDPMRAGI